MHSVNWCHVLSLSLDDDGDAAGGRPRLTGRWERVTPLEGSTMHAAAYHSAVALEPERDSVLIYGGMAQSDGVDHISVINTVTSEVYQPEQEEEDGTLTPAGRYGAAVHVIGTTIWVIGGCDGGDLLREGDDFNDIHAADIRGLLGDRPNRKLRWLALPPITVPVYCAGREMASVRWGRKIMLHGGSTDASNVIVDELGDRVMWFDSETLSFGQPAVVGPIGPLAALSVEAVLIGSSIYIHVSAPRQSPLASPAPRPRPGP
jgi:hypothetical protein